MPNWTVKIYLIVAKKLQEIFINEPLRTKNDQKIIQHKLVGKAIAVRENREGK